MRISIMLRIFGSIFLGAFMLATNIEAVGLMPTPVLKNATISANALFDQGSGLYTYAYTITNPVGNTGEIWDFTIDVSGAPEGSWQTYGLTIQVGSGEIPFSEALSMLSSTNSMREIPLPLQVIPFGQKVPAGWTGGLGIDSVAHFASGDGTPNIVPGTSHGGFQLLSYHAPTIRNAEIMPLWMHIVDNHDNVTDADRLAAAQIEQDIIFKTVTLAPSEATLGSFAHWNQLRDDLVRAQQLGWISDTALANKLVTQLALARQTLDAKDFYTAKDLLQPMLDEIDQSDSSQRTSEGFALVYLNVQSLVDNTPNNQIEPKVSLVPKSTLLSIGKPLTLTVTVIDLANGSVPLVGVPVHFVVDSGPNAGLVLGDALTDVKGTASVTHSSALTGADNIVAIAFYRDEVTYEDKAVVIWSGGPDLVVPFFSPPLLITKGGNKFYMNEETQNIGNVITPPSVTRYYISAAPILDVTTAILIGERSIPALKPGKSNSINQRVFRMPQNLPAGTYYLAACADANSTVAELDENNNCSFSKIEGRQSFIVPMKNMNANGDGEDDDECDDKEKDSDNDKAKNKDHHDEHDHNKCGKHKKEYSAEKPEVKREAKLHKEAK
jgi:hypothetical protein